MKRRQRYISYLLRLWQVRHDGEPVWRASLESPRTGKQHGFAGLDKLFDFLREQTEVASEINGDEGNSDQEI